MRRHISVREMMMSKSSLIFVVIVLLTVGMADPVLSNTRTIDEVLSGDLVRIGDSFIARLTGIKVPPRNEIMGYKIYDNLTYNAHFSYLATGDFFKMGETNTTTDDVYLIAHALSMKF